LSLDLLVPGCMIRLGSLVILDLLDWFNFATKLLAVKFCVEVDLNVLTMLFEVLGVSTKLYRLALFDLELWFVCLLKLLLLLLLFLISLL